MLETIDDYVLNRLAGVVRRTSWGETAYFYNPGEILPYGVYFLTIKHRDSVNDNASKLANDQGFRLNLGLPRDEYTRLFGPFPKRPAKGNRVETGHDFALRDSLMPHPVYAWMGWACIVNPTPERFVSLKPLIEAAYAYAAVRFRTRTARN